MRVVDSLAPVFLIIALGFALRAGGFLTPAAIAAANRLTYWIGLPCLFVHEIVGSHIALTDHGDALAAMCRATTVVAIAAYVAAFAGRLPWNSTGAFVQGAIRGNLVFVGLPVIVFSAGSDAAAVPIAIVFLAIMLPLINVVSIIVLLVSQHRLG